MASQDIKWWTGVTCILLWCFNQLFELSFWRHSFISEDPNLLKSVPVKKQTHLHPHYLFFFFLGGGGGGKKDNEDVDEFVSSQEQILRDLDPLKWMSAVRMRVLIKQLMLLFKKLFKKLKQKKQVSNP